MPRSIQSQASYDEDLRRWAEYRDAVRRGEPTLQAAPPEPPRPKDSYPDRLTKFVPAEVVTLYLALVAAVASAVGDPKSSAWLKDLLGDNWLFTLNLSAFVIGLVATPLYLRYLMGVTHVGHILVCVGSFVIWAVAIPDGLFKDWPPIIRGFLLPLYTFAVAFYKPDPAREAGTR